MIRKSQSDLILSDRFMFPTYYMRLDKSLEKCKSILNSIQDEFNKTREQYFSQYSNTTDGESRLQDSSENDNNSPQTTARQVASFKKRKYERKPLENYKNENKNRIDSKEKGNLKKYSRCKNNGSHKKIYVDYSDNSSCSGHNEVLTKKEYSSSLNTDSEYSENQNTFKNLLNNIVSKKQVNQQDKWSAEKHISYDPKKNVLIDLENFNKAYNKRALKRRNENIALEKYQNRAENNISRRNRSLENSSLETSGESEKCRDASEFVKSYSNSAIDFRKKEGVEKFDDFKNKENHNIPHVFYKNENSKDLQTHEKLKSKENVMCEGDSKENSDRGTKSSRRGISFKIPKLDVRHLEMFLNMVKKTQLVVSKTTEKYVKSNESEKRQGKTIFNDSEAFVSCAEDDESDAASEIFEDAICCNETLSLSGITQSHLNLSHSTRRKTISKMKVNPLPQSDKLKCSCSKKNTVFSDGTIHISPENIIYSYKQEIKPCYMCDKKVEPRQEVSLKYYPNNRAILNHLCESQYKFLKSTNLESSNSEWNENDERIKQKNNETRAALAEKQEKDGNEINKKNTLEIQNKNDPADLENVKKSWKTPVKVKSKTVNRVKKYMKFINTNKNRTVQCKEKMPKTSSKSGIDYNFEYKNDKNKFINKNCNSPPTNEMGEKKFKKSNYMKNMGKNTEMMTKATCKKLEEIQNARECLIKNVENEQKSKEPKDDIVIDRPLDDTAEKENEYFKVFQKITSNETTMDSNVKTDNDKNKFKENIKQENSTVEKASCGSKNKTDKNLNKEEIGKPINNTGERYPKLKNLKRRKIYVKRRIDRATNTSQSQLLCLKNSKCTQTTKESISSDVTFQTEDRVEFCVSPDRTGKKGGEYFHSYFQIPITEETMNNVYGNDNLIESSVGKMNKYGGNMYVKKHNFSYNKKIKKSRSGGGLINRDVDGRICSASNTRRQNNYQHIYAVSPVPVYREKLSKGMESDSSCASAGDNDGFYSISNSTIVTTSKNNFFVYRSEEDVSCKPIYKDIPKYNYKPLQRNLSVNNADRIHHSQNKFLFANDVWQALEPYQNEKKKKHVSFKRRKRVSSYSLLRDDSDKEQEHVSNKYTEEIKQQFSNTSVKNNRLIRSDSKLKFVDDDCTLKIHKTHSNSDNVLTKESVNLEDKVFKKCASYENVLKYNRLNPTAILHCVGELPSIEIRKPFGVKLLNEIKVLNWIQHNPGNKKAAKEKDNRFNMKGLRKSYEKLKIPAGESLLTLDFNKRKNIYSVLSKKIISNENNKYANEDVLNQNVSHNNVNNKRSDTPLMEPRQDESIPAFNSVNNTKMFRGKGDIATSGFPEYLNEIKNNINSGNNTVTKVNGNKDLMDSKLLFNISASKDTILSIMTESGEHLLVTDTLSSPLIQDYCQELKDNLDDISKLKSKKPLNKHNDFTQNPSSTKIYSTVNITLADEEKIKNKEVNVIGRILSLKHYNRVELNSSSSLKKKVATTEGNAIYSSSEQESSNTDLLTKVAEEKPAGKKLDWLTKNKNLKRMLVDNKKKCQFQMAQNLIVKPPVTNPDAKPPFTPYVNRNFQQAQKQTDSYRKHSDTYHDRLKLSREKTGKQLKNANNQNNYNEADSKKTSKNMIPKKIQRKKSEDFQTINLFTTSRLSLDSVSTHGTGDSIDRNSDETSKNKGNLLDAEEIADQKIQESMNSSSDPQLVSPENPAAHQNLLTKNKRSKSFSFTPCGQKTSSVHEISKTDLPKPVPNKGEAIEQQRSKSNGKDNSNKVCPLQSSSSGNTSSEVNSASEKSSSNSLNSRDSKREKLDYSVIKSLQDKIKSVLPKDSLLKKSLLKKVSKQKIKKPPSDIVLDCQKVDVFGAPIIDDLDISFYNEYGKPIVNIFGCKLYDKDGIPKRGAYGKPLHGALRKELLQMLEGQDVKHNFLHRKNKKFEEQLISVLEKVNGIKTDLYGRVYDSYGRPLFDRYGYLQYDLNGNPLSDAFGRPLRNCRTGQSLIKPRCTKPTPFISNKLQRNTGGGIFVHEGSEHKSDKRFQERTHVNNSSKSESKSVPKIKKQVSFDMKPIIVARNEIKPNRTIRSSSFLKVDNNNNKKFPSILKKNES